MRLPYVLLLLLPFLVGQVYSDAVCTAKTFPAPPPENALSAAFKKCAPDVKPLSINADDCTCRGGTATADGGCTVPTTQRCESNLCDRRRRIAELELYATSIHSADGSAECKELFRLLDKAADDVVNECLAAACNSPNKDCDNIEEACEPVGRLYQYYRNKANGLTFENLPGVVLTQPTTTTTDIKKFKAYLSKSSLLNVPVADIMVLAVNGNMQVFVATSEYVTPMGERSHALEDKLFASLSKFQYALRDLGAIKADVSGTTFGDCQTYKKDRDNMLPPASLSCMMKLGDALLNSPPSLDVCGGVAEYCRCLGYKSTTLEVCPIPFDLDRVKVQKCYHDFVECSYTDYSQKIQKYESACPPWIQKVQDKKSAIINGIKCAKDLGMSSKPVTEQEMRSSSDAAASSSSSSSSSASTTGGVVGGVVFVVVVIVAFGAYHMYKKQQAANTARMNTYFQEMTHT